MSHSPTRVGHTLGVTIDMEAWARDTLEEARSLYEPTSGEMRPHVTLLAPIDVDADAMPAVLRHLASVAARTEPFRLVLRGTGSFRPVTPVVFVPVVEGVRECLVLESRVRSGDMAVDTRYPYHPHVTVAHDVSDVILDRAMADLSGFSASMEVSSIRLHEHVAGRWEIVREFVLSGRDDEGSEP